MGFSKDKVIKVKPCEEYDYGVIRFKTVYAYNLNKTFHLKQSNWVGYLLEFEGKKYYIAGDTDVIMDNLSVLKNIDVAFIPIGGTYIMDVLEAADFVNKIKPKSVVPIHYGMVAFDEKDLKQFILNVSSDIKVDDLLGK